MRFTKMHGLGNDYVYINGFVETLRNPAAWSVQLSKPHTGIGADGLILILPSERADLRMRMFNADGSEAQMCGNGARCVARYAYERGLIHKTRFTLETGGGVRTIELRLRAGKVADITVDMGIPVFAPSRVPVLLKGDRVMEHDLEWGGKHWYMTCVSMGNPHAVFFIDEDPFRMADFEALGPWLERHSLFPERTNVEFVQQLSPGHLRMRVWERGSGETQACGTGACAVLAAAVATGRVAREALVSLRGGDLRIAWPGAQDSLTMTGTASFVFDGEWLADEPFSE